MIRKVNKIRKRIEQLPTVVKSKKQSMLQNTSEKQRKIIVTTGIVLGISAISLLVIHFGVKQTKKIVSKVEEKKSFSGDQYAVWAKQFKVAFLNDGLRFGTIEKLVRQTLLEIPSKQDFKKVEKSYAKMFNGEILAKTMEKELSHTEFAEMRAIFESKPEKAKDAQKGIPIFDPDGWAIRINAGVNYQWLGIGWGTDWEAIKQVILEMKNAGAQKSFEATEQVYRQSFGSSLRKDLKGDLDSGQLKWIADTLSR